jgi:hypothetical protein
MGEQFTDYVGGQQVQQHGERAPEKPVDGDSAFDEYDAAVKAELAASQALGQQRAALKARIDTMSADDLAQAEALLG